ncbi:pyridoxamine 5'-phosphate oxidase family protein [Acaryochloris sp. IP29b_bin.137]|uniref:HugZ family pyridoxamine 5'-phosphate oxidase n=1 Tax=Acaryochloris sp. IP29b_bin.137 TaxID=2969217 RepID=UPI00260A3395|nr:pyridoxamine 5'-phosphate oxidase family protein [Acaryochloris sp. IP29b_bin.137]
MSSEAKAVKKLIEQQNFGVLSTMSVDVEGFPFGSVTPYSLTENYNPLIFISNLAQHTKNITKDNRVSLIVLENLQDGTEDPQKHGRASILGRATPLETTGAENDAKYQRYFQRFPEAEGYQNTHGFQLYEITPVRIRFIGGFGKIFWLEPQQLLAS